MHWSWIGPAGAIFGGAASLLTYLGTAPFGPRTYWSWRLRRHASTLEVLDPDRQEAQRAVLLLQADRLASRLAAAYRIPTPWKSYVAGSFVLGYGLGLAYVESYMPGDNALTRVNALILCFACLLIAYRYIYLDFAFVRRERTRFMQQGCPTSFASTRTPQVIRYIKVRLHTERAIRVAVLRRRKGREQFLRMQRTVQIRLRKFLII